MFYLDLLLCQLIYWTSLSIMKHIVLLTVTVSGIFFDTSFASLSNKDIQHRIASCTQTQVTNPTSNLQNRVTLQQLISIDKERQCQRKILNESTFALARARVQRTNNLSTSYTSFKNKLTWTVDNVESIYSSIYYPVNSFRSCNPQLKLKAKMKANQFFKTILLMLAPVNTGSAHIIPRKLPLNWPLSINILPLINFTKRVNPKSSI